MTTARIDPFQRRPARPAPDDASTIEQDLADAPAEPIRHARTRQRRTIAQRDVAVLEFKLPADVRSAEAGAPTAVRRNRIPWAVKSAYAVFVLVMVPYYGCALGPVNFLYYCDFALLLALPAIWLESRLLVSTVTVGILLPQTLWILDFLAGFLDFTCLGIANYMFRPDLPLFARGLSTFHLWQPVLLLGLTARLGYDPRAWRVWTLLAWALMIVCYVWVPEPFNINYVFGPGDAGSQTWMPALTYFLLWMATLPLLMIWPAHRLLRRHFAMQGI